MLSKLKVLSFTHYLQGPSCSQILGDLGADVLKIESPKGAFERGWSGPGAFKNGVSVFFLAANRNVGSLAIDLKSPEGKEIIYKLLDEYDIIIENFRPGVMNKLGFSYEEMKKRNPRVIYCSCTGYGPDGPYKDKPGQDILAQSMSGLMDITGNGKIGPSPVGCSAVDQHGATLAALGVIAAAFDRAHTGKGHRVDATLLSAALDLQLEIFSYYLNARETLLPKRPTTGLGSRMNPSPYGAYETADGYLTISLNAHENLVKIFEPGALGSFTADDCINRRVEYDAVVAEQFKKRTTEEWIPLLEENRMWYTKPHTYDDVVEDSQVQWNQSILSFEHPKAGSVRVLGHPLKYDGQNCAMRKLPPNLGESALEALQKIGYSEQQVHALREQGVLAWATESSNT